MFVPPKDMEEKFPLEAVVAPIVVPLIVPPVIAAEEEAKLLAVTRPDPKVTGLLVTVLIDRVDDVVRSMTGLVEEILVETLFRVTVPVPVANVFDPVIVVAPFKDTAPEPVPNVPAPFCIKFFPEAMATSPFRDTVPVPVEKVFAPV